MRLALAAIAPNITVPTWARLFKHSILPVVDECRFLVGTPLEDVRLVAQDVLGFANLDVRQSFVGHGEALNELCARCQPHDEILIIEDDCYVTCGAERIEQIFDTLDQHPVMGSRMARGIDNAPPPILDTYGDGLYPNMMFARVEALGPIDWRSRDGGDTGQLLGEAIHARGLHTAPEAHLPQCRLSGYPGCIPVDVGTWAGPWLHVGEMSVIQNWRLPRHRHGHWEAVAAFAAAFDMGEVRPGSTADLVREIINTPCYGASQRFQDLRVFFRDRVYP